MLFIRKTELQQWFESNSYEFIELYDNIIRIYSTEKKRFIYLHIQRNYMPWQVKLIFLVNAKAFNINPRIEYRMLMLSVELNRIQNKLNK